jgi:methylmalonyl-CoA/ethylmalonyl-CoA epimerase
MKLHHVGIAVSSIETQGTAYCQALSLPPPGPTIEDPIQRVSVAFCPASSDVSIEFVEPLGDDSPISNLLSRGGGVYHVCYEVPDLDAAIEEVRRQHGVVVAKPAPAPAFDGRRIAFCHVGGSLVEFVES